MSIDALSWAFNLELPSPGVKLTLLALANYSDEYGEAYPSQKAMAKKTCLCERAIRTHLVTLEKLGIITRKSRKRENGSYTSDLFHIKIGSKITSGINCQRQILPTAENDISQRQILPNPAADSAYPDPSLSTTVTKNDPPVKPKREKKGVFVLPDWIPEDTWKEFDEMRKSLRKPMTLAAMNLIVSSLEKLQAGGENVKAVLEQSIMNSWQGVFPIKTNQVGSFMNHKDKLNQQNKESTLRAKARLFGSSTEKDVTNETTRL